jgi:gluconate 2-dehydrogenase gamma chain
MIGLFGGGAFAAGLAHADEPASGNATREGGGEGGREGGLGKAAPRQHRHAGQPAERALVFFNADEAALVGAAIDRLIPADEAGPGAVEAGLVLFIDRQLAGGYGQGEGLYLAGPWPEGAMPQQGYQLPLTPAALYRIGIAELDQAVRRDHGKAFAELPAVERDAVLTALERGELALETLPGKVFFDLLLADTLAGYFADPAYGGNQGMGGWRMIGFPGARGDYADLIIPFRNKPFGEEPEALIDLQ